MESQGHFFFSPSPRFPSPRRIFFYSMCLWIHVFIFFPGAFQQVFIFIVYRADLLLPFLNSCPDFLGKTVGHLMKISYPRRENKIEWWKEKQTNKRPSGEAHLHQFSTGAVTFCLAVWFNKKHELWVWICWVSRRLMRCDYLYAEISGWLKDNLKWG